MVWKLLYCRTLGGAPEPLDPPLLAFCPTDCPIGQARKLFNPTLSLRPSGLGSVSSVAKRFKRSTAACDPSRPIQRERQQSKPPDMRRDHLHRTHRLRVVLGPLIRMAIDTPRGGATLRRPFVVAGWAPDLAAAHGSGIDTVPPWAYPATGENPVFLGAATVGDERP